MIKTNFYLTALFSRRKYLILINKYWILRSFVITLLFLLIISYWFHLSVSHEMNPNESVTIIMDNPISGCRI
jgi:hypothetical protein